MEAAYLKNQVPEAQLRPPIDINTIAATRPYGTPTVEGNLEDGLLPVPIHMYASPERKGMADSPLGIDLRGDTGTFRLRYGVATVDDVGLDFFFQRYEPYYMG